MNFIFCVGNVASPYQHLHVGGFRNSEMFRETSQGRTTLARAMQIAELAGSNGDVKAAGLGPSCNFKESLGIEQFFVIIIEN